MQQQQQKSPLSLRPTSFTGLVLMLVNVTVCILEKPFSLWKTAFCPTPSRLLLCTVSTLYSLVAFPFSKENTISFEGPHCLQLRTKHKLTQRHAIQRTKTAIAMGLSTDPEIHFFTACSKLGLVRYRQTQNAFREQALKLLSSHFLVSCFSAVESSNNCWFCQLPTFVSLRFFMQEKLGGGERLMSQFASISIYLKDRLLGPSSSYEGIHKAKTKILQMTSPVGPSHTWELCWSSQFWNKVKNLVALLLLFRKMFSRFSQVSINCIWVIKMIHAKIRPKMAYLNDKELSVKSTPILCNVILIPAH